jgi:hypothetical protein
MSTWSMIATRLVAFVLVTIAAIFSPALMSAGWHVFHGSSVRYRDLRVRVPWLWTADTQDLADDPPLNPQGLLLSKAAPSLLAPHKSTATIYVNVLLPDATTSQQKEVTEWESTFRLAHSHADSAVTEAPIPGAKGASCVEARTKLFPNRLEWTCISVVGGWAASFDGSQTEAPVFVNLVSALKP